MLHAVRIETLAALVSSLIFPPPCQLFTWFCFYLVRTGPRLKMPAPSHKASRQVKGIQPQELDKKPGSQVQDKTPATRDLEDQETSKSADLARPMRGKGDWTILLPLVGA